MRHILLILLTIPFVCAGQYETFNTELLDNYGAEHEPIMYSWFGDSLRFIDDGAWEFESENSKVACFETNLPARSYIEYGETDSYGKKTEVSDRYYFNHIHYLDNLETNKTYHYRYVAEDERGNVITSDDMLFTPKEIPGAVHIPDDLSGPPYEITQPGRYIVTENLTIDHRAFNIFSADVTLDLNGHTVIYDNRHYGPVSGYYIHNSAMGAYTKDADNLLITNGRIMQGAGNDEAPSDDALGYNPLAIHNSDNTEIAGLTIQYNATQMVGLYYFYSKVIDLHHNIFKDTGYIISNRHWPGSRGVYLDGVENTVTHHNLVKRTRQNGKLGGDLCYDNEIYIDSNCINSFGIAVNAGGEAYGNKVIAHGYHAVAFGWGTEYYIHDNFVYLYGDAPQEQNLDPFDPYSDYGIQSSVNGFRLTQYGSATKEFINNRYYHNLIVGKGRSGTTSVRGTQFSSDPYVKDLVVKDTTIKIEVEDDTSRLADTKSRAACIVAHGNPDRADTALPIKYINMTLISNICNVRYGDDYARGSNHQIINSTFIRTGTDPDYHTFIYDGNYFSKHNVIQDCTFEGGAAIDDVYWKQTGVASYYSVKWTVKIITEPDSEVTITDADGSVEFSGNSGASGTISVPLTEMEIRPVEWSPGHESGTVSDHMSHQKILKTPHTIRVVSSQGETEQDFDVASGLIVEVGSFFDPADDNKDGCVSGNELAGYIADMISRQSKSRNIIRSIVTWKSGCTNT